MGADLSRYHFGKGILAPCDGIDLVVPPGSDPLNLRQRYPIDGNPSVSEEEVMLMARIGRNLPCPCGSGKKYKLCCGRSTNELQDTISMRAASERQMQERQMQERQMQAIGKLLEGGEFETLEEGTAFLQNQLTQGAIPIPPETPQEQAQELVYQAWEASSRRQRERLALQALDIDADCTDAYVLLAETVAEGPQEARVLYQKGVGAGKRSLGLEVFERDAGHFWEIIETRPYMRACQGLAQVLWALGDVDGAVEQYQDMLRLNPNDNQGVRYELLECLLTIKDLEGIEELLDHYDEDISASCLFTRALVSFLRQGDTTESRDALAAGMDENPYVVQYLLGKTRLPRILPEYMGMGDRDEAIIYASSFGKAWKKYPRALAWLEATEEPETEEPETEQPEIIDLENVGNRNGSNGTVVDLPTDLGDGLLSNIVVEEEEYSEPSQEDWAALYGAAASFKKQSPWRWMNDLDPFAVENPAGGQTGYCVIMGSGGREFGLAVFLGEEGFEHYRRIESGELDPESIETAFMLRSLSLTYGSRGELEKKDLATIRSLGLRFRGKMEWPLFRSQRPGWMPWFLAQDEVRFLTILLQQALDVSARVRDEDLELQQDDDGELVLTRYFQGTKWREEWRKPGIKEPEIVPGVPDPERLNELRQSAGKPSGTWEIDMFPLAAPVPAESGRLYLPRLALAVDKYTGMVLGLELLGPTPDATAKQDGILRLLESARHIPRQLRVATEEMRLIIEPTAENLGMSVRVGVLPALEEAKHDLQDSLLSRDF